MRRLGWLVLKGEAVDSFLFLAGKQLNSIFGGKTLQSIARHTRLGKSVFSQRGFQKWVGRKGFTPAFFQVPGTLAYRLATVLVQSQAQTSQPPSSSVVLRWDGDWSTQHLPMPAKGEFWRIGLWALSAFLLKYAV